MIRGNDEFALDLYANLRGRPGNLFLSPYSLSTALAMTYAGARGETAEEMARTLHFSLPPDRLHAAFSNLIRQIHGDGEPRPYLLAVANALWGQEGEEYLPEFLRLLEDHYGAGLRRVNFRDPERARRAINAWAEEQTRGKIPDLLPPTLPRPDTALALTNAIYFKGDWSSPFARKATLEEDFRVAADQSLRVPMMHQAGRFPYLDGGTFQALELPYAGDALSMVVLLPKEVDGLAALEESLSAARLAGWLRTLADRRVEVALPRFKVEAGLELQDVLAAMGMPLAFTGDADFSGIDGTHELFISAVIHKAFVDVNEEGTEAAAATAVLMSRSAARPEPSATFRADHPFLFLIRHKGTGSILFLGRLASPGG
jgi:serpin B